MAFTSADLAAIERAIKAGVLSVRAPDGRMVTYASMDDLLKARATIAAEVNGAAAAPVDRSVFAEFSRG